MKSSKARTSQYQIILRPMYSIFDLHSELLAQIYYGEVTWKIITIICLHFQTENAGPIFQIKNVPNFSCFKNTCIYLYNVMKRSYDPKSSESFDYNYLWNYYSRVCS